MTAEERLHPVHKTGMLGGTEVGPALRPDGKEVGMAFEELLHDSGDVGAGPDGRSSTRGRPKRQSARK